MRRCLLKGCEQRFHPRQARQRYCSEVCREAAQEWSRRKAQERYRATTAGQQKRNGQSQRYRERVKSRKPSEPGAVDEAARVITTEEFFRSFLRPARLLRGIRAYAAKPLTALQVVGFARRLGPATPIVVVAAEGQADRYVVIDGYKRIVALEQLDREAVEAVVWPMSEAAAVLLDRSLRLSEHESALEVGWLLAELEQRFGYGLD